MEAACGSQRIREETGVAGMQWATGRRGRRYGRTTRVLVGHGQGLWKWKATGFKKRSDQSNEGF